MKPRAATGLAETARRGRETLVRVAAFVSARAVPWSKVLLGAGMLVLFSALGLLARRESPVARAENVVPEAGAPVSSLPLPSTLPTAGVVASSIGVPATAPPVVPALASRARASPEDPVVLNTATLEELERIPGVGPKKAQGILALRQKMGRFRQVEDLLRVKGIGRGTLKKIRPVVRVDPPVGFLDAGRAPP